MIATLLGAGAAAAHSRLESSDPADGARVSASPASVTLTFNEAIQESFAVLTVVGPDGNFWQNGDPTVFGPTLKVGLRPLGPAGEYQINYRVTSADGHPVEGKRSFTLTVAGTGTPGPSAAQPASGSGGLPVWPFIVVGIVILLGGAGVVVWMSRRRA
ncbi:copper resistance protein CopC [Gordonia sp. TBRC 11910]|uniref:Copper resistance protein CopC n=1 Tax=Gordonia asplenii TaxID=2725283 RepID=A0A848L1Y8_9ACTN|nr:copper resistance protein CopC [Gordonia asplenii]NMO05030.1 copper resistance protein CopC [Gordonia asplenii]